MSIESLRQVQGMGHGLDAGSVDLAHLAHQLEHPVQALQNRGGFLGLDGDAGEPRDAAHVVGS